jgi:DNA polymerase-3 subunit delta'
MAFESIPEQKGVVRRLRAALQSGRLPHACLFVGSAGTGRLAAARELAHVLLCSSSKHRDGYCDRCDDCRFFEAGTHPDYAETSVPEGKQSLPIEAVRGVQHAAALKPVRGNRRVFVVRDAERMTLEAANCFLKTLEEPAGNSVFILIASSLRSIPETIVSRCRIIRFANLPADVLEARLEAGGMGAEDAHWLARRVWGSPGLAAQFQEQGLQSFNRELVARLQALSLDESFAMADWLSRMAHEAAAAGQEQRIALQELIRMAPSSDERTDSRPSGPEQRIALQELLECAAAYYRDLALAAAAGDKECDLHNVAAEKEIRKSAAEKPTDDFLERADLVLDAIDRIGANANSRLALDQLFACLGKTAKART